MSWRDHEYDHGTYLPRRCRQPESAADLLRKKATELEAECAGLRAEMEVGRAEAVHAMDVLRADLLRRGRLS